MSLDMIQIRALFVFLISGILHNLTAIASKIYIIILDEVRKPGRQLFTSCKCPRSPNCGDRSQDILAHKNMQARTCLAAALFLTIIFAHVSLARDDQKSEKTMNAEIPVVINPDMIEAAKKAAEISHSIFNSENFDENDWLPTLAEIYMQDNDCASARSTLKTLLDFQIKKHGKQNWRVKNTQLALERLDMYESISPEKREKLKELYQTEADVLQLNFKGNYRDAIVKQVSVITSMKQILRDDNVMVAESLFILAKIYSSTHEYDKSKSAYEEALKIQRNIHGNEHPVIASLLSELGQIIEKRVFRRFCGSNRSDFASWGRNQSPQVPPPGPLLASLISVVPWISTESIGFEKLSAS